jgi:HSP20 family molecular chaperone IbpA
VAEEKGLTVAEKREVDQQIHRELRSGNWFVPAADIYETPEKVVLVMDMPGVCFDCAHVNIVDDELVVTGHVAHGEDHTTMCSIVSTMLDITTVILACRRRSIVKE